MSVNLCCPTASVPRLHLIAVAAQRGGTTGSNCLCVSLLESQSSKTTASAEVIGMSAIAQETDPISRRTPSDLTL
jgi:hypothetical protein